MGRLFLAIQTSKSSSKWSKPVIISHFPVPGKGLAVAQQPQGGRVLLGPRNKSPQAARIVLVVVLLLPFVLSLLPRDL